MYKQLDKFVLVIYNIENTFQVKLGISVSFF